MMRTYGAQAKQDNCIQLVFHGTDASFKTKNTWAQHSDVPVGVRRSVPNLKILTPRLLRKITNVYIFL